MSIIAIIQARMTSQRYPGKMLAPFLGKPLLSHVVEQIKNTNINPSIILATSQDEADDPLVAYANTIGLYVVRGPRDDVMARFVQTLDEFPCEAFFRVCGDSPFLMTALFEEAARLYWNEQYDLITNVFPRTFPVGISVELLRTETFLNAEANINDQEDREHLTRYLYRHSEKFRIYNIECTKSIESECKLVVDELEDLKKLESWHSCYKKWNCAEFK